jgi:hypothetical protein
MSLIHNERVKLTATWCNTLATALVAAGGFAPGAALVWGLAPSTTDFRILLLIVLACLALGLSLHFVGRAFLGRLRE